MPEGNEKFETMINELKFLALSRGLPDYIQKVHNQDGSCTISFKWLNCGGV